MTTKYLALAEVLEMHRVLIDAFGGAHGLREPGALESALMRPQLGYYEDIVQEAAALLESLALIHPFVDVNKRIAFAVADTFLRLNGRVLQADSLEAYDFFIGLFNAGTFRYEHLEPWIRKHLSKT
jgi:death-on-curing protein